MSSSGIIAFNDDVYLPHEIAEAAGVPLEQVVAAVGGDDVFVTYGPAVRLGRRLAGLSAAEGRRVRPLFAASYSSRSAPKENHLPLILAGALHACVIAAVAVLTAAGRTTSASSVQPAHLPSEDVRLVFLAERGPGGGGGGGGLKQPAHPSKAEARGSRKIGNPLERRPPVPAEPPATPPPLAAEPFPVIVAPIAPPAGVRSRVGLDDNAEGPVEVHGSGTGGGVGTGAGAGSGSGRGSGLGDGTGGGFGGGVFRAGSGVEPPRVIREIKADYPDEARRLAIQGEVVVELVVRRDGSVGDARIVRHLNPALDERALQAVRQWRFEPGKFRGSPVDVAVEVVVEFRLR